MVFFFLVKTSITFGIVEDSNFYNLVEYLCFISFCIPSYFIAKTFLNKRREEKKKLDYNKKRAKIFSINAAMFEYNKIINEFS